MHLRKNQSLNLTLRSRCQHQLFAHGHSCPLCDENGVLGGHDGRCGRHRGDRGASGRGLHAFLCGGTSEDFLGSGLLLLLQSNMVAPKLLLSSHHIGSCSSTAPADHSSPVSLLLPRLSLSSHQHTPVNLIELPILRAILGWHLAALAFLFAHLGVSTVSRIWPALLQRPSTYLQFPSRLSMQSLSL